MSVNGTPQQLPSLDVERAVDGPVTMRRVGRFSFPVFELVDDGGVIASLGRRGWIKIFFGRGQRVELRDGTRWRIKSLGIGGKISPAIFDDDGRRIAVASIGVGGYGINGKRYGCVMYAAERRRFGRSNRWIIRQHESELAELVRHPPSVEVHEALHVGAILLSFTLVRYGILGESAPRLTMRWGRA